MLIYALMGNPVSSSLSPIIHGFIYSRLKMEATYIALSISPKRLMHAVEVAKEAFNGFNVTIPYKSSIMDYLDGVDDRSKVIGAVNTVTIEAGEAVGHNTDALAIAELVEERGIKCGSALLVGAGGSARAVMAALSSKCSSISIANRNRNRAEALVSLGEFLGIDVKVIRFSDRESALNGADLVINATPLGMYVEEDPIDPRLLGLTRPAVIDLAYSKDGTRLSNAAKSLGLPVIDGLNILIRQAIKSEELWLGRMVDISDDEVRRVVAGGER